jgi:hypothetical protein
MSNPDILAETNLPSRRSLLRTTAAGFGQVALAALLGERATQAAPAATPAPLTAKPGHFPPKAKRIIFLFMEGAMSQMDTFEYKPRLQAEDGKPGPGGGTLVGSKFKFQKYGQTGSWVSELYPHTARHVDKFCFLRGLHTDTPAHPQAVIQLHTGTALASLTRPSMGAWLLYGLGSENADLPGYITINPPPNFGGAVNYGSAFLPAHFQGTRITDRGQLSNVKAQLPLSVKRRQIDLIQSMNRHLAARSSAPEQIDSVIESFELAFRMQGKVPELLDLSREPESVREKYGIKPGPAGSFARQCLMARRLSEAGVRFVEVCQSGWDHHNNLHKGLINQAAMTDQPTAALLDDLEQRGLLEDTLVLFGSEFGRMPTAQGPDGRDHNITGYPMWLAGAGVRRGYSHGGTDEYGRVAVEGRMHTTDLHATLLAFLGLDHEKLTYRWGGRDFRLTDVAGNVAWEVFARKNADGPSGKSVGTPHALCFLNGVAWGVRRSAVDPSDRHAGGLLVPAIPVAMVATPPSRAPHLSVCHAVVAIRQANPLLPRSVFRHALDSPNSRAPSACLDRHGRVGRPAAGRRQSAPASRPLRSHRPQRAADSLRLGSQRQRPRAR